MPIVRGFRRFQSNIVSSKQVTEISKLVPGLNVQKSGRSSAAPFTSKRPLRKKIAIADRKVMLESYVNKYKAMNLGKFPSTTTAQKEVGGSYYVIKKMLQEMQHDMKISAKDNKKQIKGEDSGSKEMMVEVSGSQKVPSSQINISQPLNEDHLLESSSNFHTNVESEEGLQPSTSSVDTGNNDITRDETQVIVTAKDESTSKENVGLVDSETKVELQYDGIRNITSERQKEELREKTSVWRNLKSLAIEFLNIWKK